MILVPPFAICGAWDTAPTPDKHLRIILPPLGPVQGAGWELWTQAGLAALAQHVRRGDHVLDVGTGSGIQAVAACLLGAETVTAVEKQPDALVLAPQTFALNGITDRVTLVEDIPADQFNLALICIGSEIAEELAPLIHATTLLIVHDDHSVEVRR